MQPPPGMNFDAVRDDKLRRLTVQAFRVRLMLLIPLFLVIVVPLFALGLEPWRLVGVGGTLLVLVTVFVYDVYRASRISLSQAFLTRYLPLILIVQTCGIVSTGDIDSPLLPMYIPVVFLAGALLRSFRRAAIAPALVTALLTTMAVLRGLHVLPPVATLAPSTSSAAALFLTAFLLSAVCWVVTALATLTGRLYEEVERELEDARRDALEAHQERLLTLEALSRRMAHEVKNPLSAIKGLTQLLQRQGDPSGHLGVIAGEVERLTEIVDGFLSFSRPMEELRRESVDLAVTVTDVLSVLRARLDEAGIEARLVTPGPLTVSGDRRRLEQVLMNLLLNSIESLEATGPAEPRIDIRIERSGDGAALRVMDNGGGLRDAERLFQPSVSTKPRGTGLGLPISRAIVRAHGGELTLRGLEGGAEATLTLPGQPLEATP